MYKTTEELRKMSLKALQKHLEEVRSSNLSAWNTYGSELCSGAMSREEEIIEQIIKEKNNIKK